MTRPPAPKAMVITCEEWPLGFFGCYGAEWIETPQLDKWALSAVVCDQHFADDITPGATQHAWWTGRSQAHRPATESPQLPTWLPTLRAAGVHTTLIYPTEHRLPLPISDFDSAHAVSIADTLQTEDLPSLPAILGLARRTLAGWRMTSETPQLLWLHLPAIPVDLPCPAYQELYAEEADDDLAGEPAEIDEELLAAEMAFPRFWRRKRSSPRELAAAQLESQSWTSTILGQPSIDWRRRRNLYAGQVSQWDRWLGKLWDSLAERRAQAPLLTVFTAATGRPLGEHPDLPDPERPALYEEQIHLPLLLQATAEQTIPGRARDLLQPMDLPATLGDWFGSAATQTHCRDGRSLLPIVSRTAASTRAELLVRCGTDVLLRTSEFALRREFSVDDPTPREALFVKPDDRWDMDDVQRQYPVPMEELQQHLTDRLRHTAP